MTHGGKWNKNIVISKIKKLHIKLKRRPVKRDYPNLYRQSRIYFETWNKAMKAAGYKIKHPQNITIPKISNDLFYFIGLLITDGHLQYSINQRNYKVAISTSYEEEKYMILKLIKILFGYKAGMRKRKYGWNVRPNYEIFISSKKLVEFFNQKFNIPTGSKSKIVRVPKILFKKSS